MGIVRGIAGGIARQGLSAGMDTFKRIYRPELWTAEHTRQALYDHGVFNIHVVQVVPDHGSQTLTVILQLTNKATLKDVEKFSGEIANVLGVRYAWGAEYRGDGFVQLIVADHPQPEYSASSTGYGIGAVPQEGVGLYHHSVETPILWFYEDGSVWQDAAARHLIAETYDVADTVKALTSEQGLFDLFELAGLTSTRELQRSNPDGSPHTVVVTDAPEVVALSWRKDGLSAVFSALPGQTLNHWKAAMPVLQNALGSLEASLSQPEAGYFRVSLNNVNVFDNPSDFVITSPIPYDPAGKSVLGRTRTGELASIVWKDNSGMVVGGVPGSGKTASMLPVFAGMAGQVELHVHDCKLTGDLEPLRDVAAVFNEDEDNLLDVLIEDMQRIISTRVARTRRMKKVFGTSNFWNIDPAARAAAGFYPVMVIIDECQDVFDTAGHPKEVKEKMATATMLASALVKKGRSAGYCVVMTTQKPDANSLPTSVRDNAALRVAFNCTTSGQATTILPVIGDDEPTPQDIRLEDKGRCVMNVGGSLAFVQSFYATERDVAAALAGIAATPVLTFTQEEEEAAVEVPAEQPAPSLVEVPTVTVEELPEDVTTEESVEEAAEDTPTPARPMSAEEILAKLRAEVGLKD